MYHSYFLSNLKADFISQPFFAFYLFSQAWFATVHDVLHADWQDVWHSPQPPVLTVF